MKLRKEDREALEDYYKDKSPYAPESDPKQKTANFKPQPIKGEPCENCDEHHLPGMCEGGKMSKGGSVKPIKLDDGGSVKSLENQTLSQGPQDQMTQGPVLPSQVPESNPGEPSLDEMLALSAKGQQQNQSPIGNQDANAAEFPDSDFDVKQSEATVPSPAVPPNELADLVNFKAPSYSPSPLLPQIAQPQAQPQNVAPKPSAPKASPVKAPVAQPSGGLNQDQLDALIQALGKKTSGRQMLSEGFAGLGDAIMQGVGRTQNPGFLKATMEKNQQQKENLINALREKYEKQFQIGNLAINRQKANADIQNQQSERTLQNKGLNQELLNQQNTNAQAKRALDINTALGIVKSYNRFSPSGPTKDQFDQATAVLQKYGIDPNAPAPSSVKSPMSSNAPKPMTTANGVKYTVNH